MENKKPPPKRKLDYINLPKFICKYLFGKSQSHLHRCILGTLFIVFGIIMGAFGDQHEHAARYIFDGISSFLHGAGCIPYFDLFTEVAE